MQLKVWLNAEHGRASALAKHLRVSRSMVSQMIRDVEPVRIPPKHYRAIRDFTRSEVTLEDLVPEAHDKEPS